MSSGSPGAGSGTTRPLLFERLVDAGPGGAHGLPLGSTGTRAEVEASVAREVGVLVNTRIAPEVDAMDPCERTALEYGLPDFTGLSPMSGPDRDRVARTVERAIRAFEPRLAEPRVSVIEEQIGRESLGLAISGTLVVDAVPATFTFDLALAAPRDSDGE